MIKNIMEKYEDTIAAISTPPGEGGIGIVRISGPLSLGIMKKLFKTSSIRSGEKEAFPIPRHAYFGRFMDNNDELIDDVICIYFEGPRTYTREDMVEIQAHGSPVSLRKILSAVIEAGARIAEPGEFTKLAFMNGRIDLSQAEAVMDLISAKTDTPHGIAIKQLSGNLKAEIEGLRNKLRDMLAQITVNIDFPDEDIEQREYEAIIKDLENVKQKVDKIANSAESGRIARDGVKTSIIGKPNVGKSSLMNGLLGEDRAIVTNIPGTTRDLIEEQVNYKGIPIILTDTAGIRDSHDEVEKIGIDKARLHIETSDILIFVIDGSIELTYEDFSIIDMIKKVIKTNNNLKSVIAVINKNDLDQIIDEKDVLKLIPEAMVIKTSLIEYDGAHRILEEIGNLVLKGTVTSEMGNIITNERHNKALNSASEELSDALNSLVAEEALDIAEIPVHRAYDFLGEILGETAGEEILDAVFTRFCLGK